MTKLEQALRLVHDNSTRHDWPDDIWNAIEEALAEQAEQEHKCKDHPDAPHGFCRNESITQDRYVCECEFWEPPKAAEQEPVGWYKPSDFVLYRTKPDDVFVYAPLYAAPVHTKDLTDDEISEVVFSIVGDTPTNYERRLCRAVIAADREKNRGTA